MQHYKQILILLGLFISFALQAQVGQVKYVETLGIGNKNYYNLFFDASISYYEQIMDSLPKTKRSQIDLPVSTQIKAVYHNRITKKIIFIDRVATDFYTVEDQITPTAWKIEPITKKIGNYTCQKANGVFRGINYVAWFTTDIPVSWGPWKINGLSGLIIELYNEDKKFHVIAYELNLNHKTSAILETKKTNIESLNKISLQKYISIKNKEDDLLDRYYESLFARGTYFGIESSDKIVLEKFE